ncbi:MAG: penicillin-binding transpeptidase domain-containing protein [Pseudomonadota bacterium]
MSTERRDPISWKEYQSPKHDWRNRRFFRRVPRALLYGTGAFLIVVLVVYAGSLISGYLGEASHRYPKLTKSPHSSPRKISNADLPGFLKGLDLCSTEPQNHFITDHDGARLRVESSIDPGLQDYITALLASSKTLKAAVVALRPEDGRVLAMVHYDNGGDGWNLCLKADFPAASLFKIVSAAAALESAGLTPDSPVYFTGRKYTLYKSQLKEKKGGYATKTSFKKAFASSINSVFGKLGIYQLGQERIADSASKFFFNRIIPFDLPVAKSTIQVPDENFGLAEIASGFNKRTLISPLHAAILASAVANDGVMMRPWLIKSVSNEEGDVLFECKPVVLGSPITKETARDLRILMQETVINGTCRKSFRRVRRKKPFREVEFGAKTGSINDETGRFKYDWLAAYAIPPNGDKAICIAVLGVHGERLGIRASELGRYILSYYLKS